MFLCHCTPSSMAWTLASSSSKYRTFVLVVKASAIVPVKQEPAALTFASTASRRSRVRSASLNGQPQVFRATFLAFCCCRLRADAASCPMWISSSAAALPVSICTFVLVKQVLFVLVKQAPELATTPLTRLSCNRACNSCNRAVTEIYLSWRRFCRGRDTRH